LADDDMLKNKWGDSVMPSLKAIVAVVCLTAPAQAEQVQFRIVDALWVTHETRGEGVEFIYQFASKPDDNDEVLMAFAFSECNRVGPKYLPGILENVGKTEVDYIAMTFRFGGAFGSYIKWFADYENGVCANIE
jgi:hypothetical protein